MVSNCKRKMVPHPSYDLLGATRAVTQAKTSGKQCNVAQIAARFDVPRSTLVGASAVPEGQRRPVGRPKNARKAVTGPEMAQPAKPAAVQKENVNAGRPQKTRILGALQAVQHADGPATAATGCNRKPSQPQQPDRAARRSGEQLDVGGNGELPRNLGPATASEIKRDAAQEAKDAVKRHCRNETAMEISQLYGREETWGPLWAEAAHISLHAIDMIELVEARFPAEYEVLCAHYLGNCYESEPGPASRLRWGNQAEKKLDRLLSEPALRYAVEREAAIFGAADLLGMFQFVEKVVLRDREAAGGRRLADLEVAAKLLSRAQPLLYSLAAGSLQEVLQPEIFGLFGSAALAALDVLDEAALLEARMPRECEAVHADQSKEMRAVMQQIESQITDVPQPKGFRFAPKGCVTSADYKKALAEFKAKKEADAAKGRERKRRSAERIATAAAKKEKPQLKASGPARGAPTGAVPVKGAAATAAAARGSKKARKAANAVPSAAPRASKRRRVLAELPLQ